MSVSFCGTSGKSKQHAVLSSPLSSKGWRCRSLAGEHAGSFQGIPCCKDLAYLSREVLNHAKAAPALC